MGKSVPCVARARKRSLAIEPAPGSASRVAEKAVEIQKSDGDWSRV
jgi:hypothetical protein